MIYFIQAGENGPIKIGNAQNPRDRLKDLQVGNHETLRLIATIPGGPDREREIHRDLEVFCYRGEWFCPNGEVFDYIDRAKRVDYELVDGMPIAILWRRHNHGLTAYCPFCGERHNHEGEDGHYEAACLPRWLRGQGSKRKLDDETIIKQADGYIIRTNKELPMGFGEG